MYFLVLTLPHPSHISYNFLVCASLCVCVCEWVLRVFVCVGTCQNRLHLPESSKHCQSVLHLSIDKAKGKWNILCACDPREPHFTPYSSFRSGPHSLLARVIGRVAWQSVATHPIPGPPVCLSVCLIPCPPRSLAGHLGATCSFPAFLLLVDI